MTQEVLDCLQGKVASSGVGGAVPEGKETVSGGLPEMPVPAKEGTMPEAGGEKHDASGADERVPAEKAQNPPVPAAPGQPPLGKGAFENVQTELREHLALLRAQAAEMPGFDLEQALRDPAFVRLTAPGVGVSVRDAWYALHREETERRRNEENRAMLAKATAASARRPREGGGSGGTALIAADYRSLSRAEQLRVKKRIFEAGARGEKIYP